MKASIKTSLDEPSILRPAYQGDAGYDLIAKSEPEIKGEHSKNNPELYTSIDYIEYDTDLKLGPDDSLYSLVFPRSSISKYNLALANSIGVVDTGYRDSIKIRFRYIAQPSDFVIKERKVFFKINYDKIYKKGDRIAQLIWMLHNHPYLQFTNDLPISQRQFGGFGSSGI